MAGLFRSDGKNFHRALKGLNEGHQAVAILEEPCSACGEVTKVHIGQAIGFGDDLVWSKAVRCSACGAALEVDDLGQPPEPYRGALIREQGCWAVEVDDARWRATVARVVRKLFNLTASEAYTMSKAIPGELWCGTRVEAEWLSRHLQAVGVELQVRRLGQREE